MQGSRKQLKDDDERYADDGGREIMRGEKLLVRCFGGAKNGKIMTESAVRTAYVSTSGRFLLNIHQIN